MISDIKERIEKERVVLSTLPKNNKKNRDRYLDTVRGIWILQGVFWMGL